MESKTFVFKEYQTHWGSVTSHPVLQQKNALLLNMCVRVHVCCPEEGTGRYNSTLDKKKYTKSTSMSLAFDS